MTKLMQSKLAVLKMNMHAYPYQRMLTLHVVVLYILFVKISITRFSIVNRVNCLFDGIVW